MHFHLLKYISFYPSLLTYLLIINSIYEEMLLNIDWKFLQNHT